MGFLGLGSLYGSFYGGVCPSCQSGTSRCGRDPKEAPALLSSEELGLCAYALGCVCHSDPCFEAEVGAAPSTPSGSFLQKHSLGEKAPLPFSCASNTEAMKQMFGMESWMKLSLSWQGLGPRCQAVGRS